ncbi:MAG: RuBisCO large subunit C-terminal-like domain-containing protein [Candidatus Methanodesulfokora sp.]
MNSTEALRLKFTVRENHDLFIKWFERIKKWVETDLERSLLELNNEGDVFYVQVPRTIFDINSGLLQSLALVINSLPHGNIRLEDVEADFSYMSGPSNGAEGIIRSFGTRGVILGAVLRPIQGIHPADLADVSYKLISAGLDFIRDIPGLIDQEASQIGLRISLIGEKIDKVKEETGRRAVYWVNVTSRLGKLIDIVQKSLDNGTRTLFYDLSIGCMDGITAIREAFGKKVFLYVNLPSYQSPFSPSILAKFARLYGADIVERPGYYGTNREEVSNIDRALASDIGVKKSLPAARNIHPGEVEANLAIFGEEQAIIADEAVYGHPMGEEAGVRSMRECIDAFLRGEKLPEIINSYEEIKIAVEKWGILAVQ